MIDAAAAITAAFISFSPEYLFIARKDDVDLVNIERSRMKVSLWPVVVTGGNQ